MLRRACPGMEPMGRGRHGRGRRRGAASVLDAQGGLADHLPQQGRLPQPRGRYTGTASLSPCRGIVGARTRSARGERAPPATGVALVVPTMARASAGIVYSSATTCGRSPRPLAVSAVTGRCTRRRRPP